MTEHDVMNINYATAMEYTRPFYMVRPRIYQDGDKWCALYGENIMEGVFAYGNTPNDAAYASDKVWREGVQS